MHQEAVEASASEDVVTVDVVAEVDVEVHEEAVQSLTKRNGNQSPSWVDS